MPLQTLERVMWRIRDYKQTRITSAQLKRAIILEAGYDLRTYTKVKKALIHIGWIRTVKAKFDLTGKDIS